jgi:4-diphosphocytidyl-2-C-methyl-D-erythritol kinase
LTLRAAPAASAGDLVTCPRLPGPPGENLAAAALAAFRAAVRWESPPVELAIDKRVPVAAGLGGGSGDAAAALRLAAAASGLGDEALLLELARDLGADVPAQVRPGRWLARGAGEQLRSLPDSRAPLGILVLPAAAALSTAAVYARADRAGAARSAAELDERAAALAREFADGAAPPRAELLGNDLEDAARALCPEIDAALAQARAAGADVALLSGSGPTVLGLFAGPDGSERARTAAAALDAERRAAGAPAPRLAEPVGAAFAAVHQPLRTRP